MKLNTIDIGGKKYPLLCDLNVLDTIQTEFGSVSEFERKLLGLELVKANDGSFIYDESGKPKMRLVEPSMRAVKIALVEMINEGIAYKAMLEGKSWDMVEDMFILAECTTPYDELAKALHEEYKRCFETKKAMPTERKKTKTPKSTSLG